MSESKKNIECPQALQSLYNGIMNDESIRRYSLGWKNIITKLQKVYKDIPKTEDKFKDELLLNALVVAKGSLREDIECFSRELSISIEKLREKSNSGTNKKSHLVYDAVTPAVYDCKSCGFISTRKNEYSYIKGIMFCVGCIEDYKSGVENVTRWVSSALSKR